MTKTLPDYLVRMVRRPVPTPGVVVAGSTPVVAFGDPTRAEVATLGINPSSREFSEGGVLLDGPLRRLATLASLGATSTSSLTDAQIHAVLADCAAYFDPSRNPYRRWFDPLDRLLREALQASYYDRTACHLDLVQWATDPVWGKLRDSRAQKVLLDDGVPHLQDQLRHGTIRLIVLNGRQVIEQVERLAAARLRVVGQLGVGRLTCSLFEGEISGIKCLGWSANLQSSYGVTREFTQTLGVWLETAAHESRRKENLPMTAYEGALDANGYIKDINVHSKQALQDLLHHWLLASTAPTIGDVGTFGRRPCVKLALGDDLVVVLNADTKRSAVQEFLASAIARGDAARWAIVANRRGILNKVNFRADGIETPGWYCYVTKPVASPRTV